MELLSDTDIYIGDIVRVINENRLYYNRIGKVYHKQKNRHKEYFYVDFSNDCSGYFREDLAKVKWF